MEKSEEKILESYKILQSVKGTAKDTGYSWNRVVKALSSNGYILSETHAEILNKFNVGKSADEIAKEMSLSSKTVQAYLPRQRPVYNENMSVNALRVKQSREKHRSDILFRPTSSEMGLCYLEQLESIHCFSEASGKAVLPVSSLCVVLP